MRPPVPAWFTTLPPLTSPELPVVALPLPEMKGRYARASSSATGMAAAKSMPEAAMATKDAKKEERMLMVTQV